VGKLDDAFDLAIANSYLAQTMKSLQVLLKRIWRLASHNVARFTAAAN
jgi:hypothetical protein